MVAALCQGEHKVFWMKQKHRYSHASPVIMNFLAPNKSIPERDCSGVELKPPHEIKQSTKFRGEHAPGIPHLVPA